MLAVKAYYDGHVFVPLEQMKFKINQQALIVVDEEIAGVKGTCRGIASKYADPALIKRENEFISGAFAGECE
ncbi:MAG: hypothetical protein K6G00_09360 [Treponema sp.]|nr:hypothetical protein [Treponema sp.]